MFNCAITGEYDMFFGTSLHLYFTLL